jgi:hypothetical protein
MSIYPRNKPKMQQSHFIEEALIEATQKITKIARPSEMAKPWWNAEIQHTFRLART